MTDHNDSGAPGTSATYSVDPGRSQARARGVAADSRTALNNGAGTRREGDMRPALSAIGGSVLFVAALVGVLLLFDIDREIIGFLRWMDAQGGTAGLWFLVVMAIVVVLLLPGVLLTTGAGFVFGIAEGTLYVVLGTGIGAAAAFLIARYLARDATRAALARSGRWVALQQVLAFVDARTVLLTRLVPFFPGKLSNYAFGLTSVPFLHYCVATLVGLVPFSLHNVYLGSMAASLLTLGAERQGRSVLEWSIYGIGFVGTVLAVIYCSRLAQRALAAAPVDADTGS
jgi:uncharacterized membrane protein YdjX (TVP38/TMEM64 family)